MKPRPILRTVLREWFCALLCFSLLIAPFGCQLLNSFVPDGDGNGDSLAGLFINDDFSDPLLLAGRSRADDTFYVYGTRDDRGYLRDITSIVVRSADGEESFISFEDGRPVHIQGANGSYVHITYEEVSTKRLAASAELYNSENGEKATYSADIDLQETAQQVAAFVQDLTGRTIDTTDLPTGDDHAKTSTHQVRITIFSPLFIAFVAPLALAVATMTVILGQILMVIYAAVVVAVQAVVLAVFAPLFLCAEILGDAIVKVELIPIPAILDIIPPPPVIILT